jgi:ATP-dependent Lhr-like helicase
VGGTPKGRLFATSRDDLIECAALLDCVRRGELDILHIPKAPLDVLAQQIVAEVSCQEWPEQALLETLRRASPYAELDDDHYQALLHMLAEALTVARACAAPTCTAMPSAAPCAGAGAAS